jgi:hypothetical protein
VEVFRKEYNVEDEWKVAINLRHRRQWRVWKGFVKTLGTYFNQELELWLADV